MTSTKSATAASGPLQQALAVLWAGPHRVRELVETLDWIGLRPGEVALLLGLTFGHALTEGIGIGLIYPLLAFIAGGTEAFAADAPFPLPQFAGAVQFVGLPLNLPVLLFIVFVAFAIREVITFLRASSISRIGYRHSAALQARAASVYIEAGLPFHSGQNRGAIIASLMADCSQSAALVKLAVEALGLIAMSAVFVTIMAMMSIKLTAMIALGAVLTLPLFRGQTRRVQLVGNAILDANKAFSIRLNETFQAIRLVKVRGQEQQAAQRIAEASSTAGIEAWRRDHINAQLDSTIRPVFMIAVLVVFYIALAELDATLASLLTFVFTTTRLVPAMTRLGVLRGLIPSYLHGPQRVREMMAQARRLRTVTGGNTPFRGVGDGIRFENVSFFYDGAKDRPALRDVSFAVVPGETTAVVGPSGAGKSTLMDLLCRFYDPLGGRIVIDGRDMRDYDIASYQARVSFVPQEPVMFDDSIRENLQYGMPAPLSDDVIHAALDQAHCLDFVSALPNGIDTMIGERAVRLSGGQRQRLALARALVNEPDVLLLDEPTSALDSVSEEAIQNSLKALHGKVTIIVVAHRLSTIVNADRIFVLQNGYLVAEGKHAALIEKAGVYRDLFQAQASLAG